MRVAVVGPCASGKTLLASALADWGFEAYSVPQEHSSVRRLFMRREPDAVVFLDASYDSISQRRRVSWGPEALSAQMARLKWARREADIVVCTDGKEPRQVLEEVVVALNAMGPGRVAPHGEGAPV